MAITLTERAAAHVTNTLAKRGKGIGLRLGVKTVGCSGLAYVITQPDPVVDDDVVFDQDGVRVVVSRQDLAVIDGTVVDFVREGLNEAFRFRNPNAKGECGCGESFTV